MTEEKGQTTKNEGGKQEDTFHEASQYSLLVRHSGTLTILFKYEIELNVFLFVLK